MKNKVTANRILRELVSLIHQAGEKQGFRCQPWFQGAGRLSKNIVDFSGSINCLAYIKVRSERPFRWGVTANRIDELKQSCKDWVIVLLHETPETGYLLTSDNVDCYLPIWPLGSDGDYKVGPGSYLKFNRPFYSFNEFIDLLSRIKNQNVPILNSSDRLK